MDKYTIKSFFELTSTQTGRSRVLTLGWVLKMMSMPPTRHADEQKCIQFAADHGWGGERLGDVKPEARLTFPITMWEALEAAFEVWPEAFVFDPVDLADYLKTYLEKHGLDHRMSTWVSGEPSPTVAVRVISELRQQLDEEKKICNDVESLERYLAKHFKAELEDSNERVPVVAIKVLARLNQANAHAEAQSRSFRHSDLADSRALATLMTLDHFVRDNFPSEYERFNGELGTSLMVQNIMLELRDARRQSDAFPLWERSWEQMNRLADFVRSHNREAAEQIYDDKRVVIPEMVTDVVQEEYLQASRADTAEPHAERAHVDRTPKVRAQIVEKVFTGFVTAMLGRKKFNGDMQECYDAMAAWDLSIHEPPWFGVEVWHIDNDGCLMITEEAEETEPEE